MTNVVLLVWLRCGGVGWLTRTYISSTVFWQVMETLVPWLATWGYSCKAVTNPPTLFFNASDSEALKCWLQGIGGDFLFGILKPNILLATSVSLVGTAVFQSGAKQPAAYLIADERAHYAEHYPNALPLTSASLPAPDAVKERLALLLYPFGTPRDVAERQLHGDSVPPEFVNYLYIRSPRPPLALVGRRARTLTGLFLNTRPCNRPFGGYTAEPHGVRPLAGQQQCSKWAALHGNEPRQVLRGLHRPQPFKL